jgi:tetratricopeptide (TPR) repeat protein
VDKELVGELESSIAAYRKSIELFQSMLAKAPDSKADLLNLVQVQNELSAAYRQLGDPRTARDWNQASAELIEQSPLASTDADVRLELARTLSVLGFNLFRAQSVGQLNPNHDLILRDEFRNVPLMDPDRQRPRPLISLRPEAKRFVLQQKRELERAIEIMDELVADAPDNDEYRAVRATCYCIMATARKGSELTDLPSIRQRAVKEFKTLVEDHPENPEYRYLLALACSLEDSPADSVDFDSLNQALEISAELVRQFPHLLDYHHLHASLQVRLARHYCDVKRLDDAWSALKLGKTSLEQLIEHTPTDRSFKPTMAAWFVQMQRLSRSLRESDDNRRAQQVQQAILEFRSELRAQPDSPVKLND